MAYWFAIGAELSVQEESMPLHWACPHCCVRAADEACE
jgi:hypothetical protein